VFLTLHLQVISRDVELPVLLEAVSPMGLAPQQRLRMAGAFGQELPQILEFNKSERECKICPRCYVLYR
jgi:hypothetical protein